MEGSDLKWRPVIAGGGERSQVEGSDLRQGALSGERSQVDGSDLRLRGAIAGGGERLRWRAIIASGGERSRVLCLGRAGPRERWPSDSAGPVPALY